MAQLHNSCLLPEKWQAVSGQWGLASMDKLIGIGYYGLGSEDWLVGSG